MAQAGKSQLIVGYTQIYIYIYIYKYIEGGRGRFLMKVNIVEEVYINKQVVRDLGYIMV